MDENSLSIVKPIITYAAMWGMLFVVLRNVVMPNFKTWRALEDWRRIEFIMRVIATLNGFLLCMVGFMSLTQPVNEPRLYVAWMMACTSGYWLYDILGNLFYYSLLKKSFILVHHSFSLFCAIFFLARGIMHMGSIPMFGSSPTDVFDHAVWFVQRLGYLTHDKMFLYIFDTVFFAVMRLVWTNYLYAVTLPVDSAFQGQPLLVRGVCYMLITLFTVMNIWLFKKHVARLQYWIKQHFEPKKK